MTWRPRLRRKEVPLYLAEKYGIDITVSTLNTYASRGGSPVMQYFGRVPLYRLEDLDEWAETRLSRPIGMTCERTHQHG